jgi:pyrimidine oxygenase
MSPAGLGFTARYGDYNFVSAKVEDIVGLQSQLREAAGDRQVGTYGLFCVISADTDAEAAAQVEHILAGADHRGIANVMGIAAAEVDSKGTAKALRAALDAPVEDGNAVFFSVPVIAGSHESVAARISEVIATTGLDGMMFTFVDYVEGIRTLGTRVLPLIEHSTANV